MIIISKTKILPLIPPNNNKVSFQFNINSVINAPNSPLIPQFKPHNLSSSLNILIYAIFVKIPVKNIIIKNKCFLKKKKKKEQSDMRLTNAKNGKSISDKIPNNSS